MTYQQRTNKEDCIAAMRAYAQHSRLPHGAVAEYVREAEHQDGYGYWTAFTPDQAVEDLQAFIDAIL
jgi:hypothetical protein